MQEKARALAEGPRKIEDVIRAVMEDPSLLDLRRPAAGLRMIIEKLHQRIEDRDTPRFRARVKEELDAIVPLLATDAKEAVRRINKLVSLARTAEADDSDWRQLADAYERFGKRVEKANEIKLRAADMISARAVVHMLTRVGEIVRARADERVAERILEDIDREVMGDSAQPDLLRELASGSMADGVPGPGS